MIAAEYLPARRNWTAAQTAVQECRGCPLYARATQAVFGSGDHHARLMLVGEQPGDEEDRQGKPFVGRAGRVLNAALDSAGIARDEIYLTNAVKHFKWTAAGPRRLHQKPAAREVKACHPWLELELDLVRPQGIVCLGAVAAQSLLGSSFRITQSRGQPQSQTDGPWILATWHPSAILRAPDEETRHRMQQELIDDLRTAVQKLQATVAITGDRR